MGSFGFLLFGAPKLAATAVEDAIEPVAYVVLSIAGGPQLGERWRVDESQRRAGAVAWVGEVDPLFNG